MNMDVIKDQICDVCHKMWQLGWVAANDGNVSAKLEACVRPVRSKCTCAVMKKERMFSA